jgi:hypothetical protein
MSADYAGRQNWKSDPSKANGSMKDSPFGQSHDSTGQQEINCGITRQPVGGPWVSKWRNAHLATP